MEQTASQTGLSDARTYVVTVLASSEAGEQFPHLCAQHGGTLTHERATRKVRLAYPIGKNNFASYFSFDITATPDTVSTMRAELLRAPSVIRALIERKRVIAVSNIPPETKTAAPVASRDERPRRFGEAALTNEDLQKKIQEILN